MAGTSVVCKKCGKTQSITRGDVGIERNPTKIPFVTPLYYYDCPNCKAKNRLWPEQVPKSY